VLRIGKLTDYATVLMTALAAEPARVHAAADLAQRGHLEPATASKILKMLAKAGLLASFRGATGGYRLARAPDEISLADIVAAMEGPFGMTECVSATSRTAACAASGGASPTSSKARCAA
jgi:FeS assembly SUF system regulator